MYVPLLLGYFILLNVIDHSIVFMFLAWVILTEEILKIHTCTLPWQHGKKQIKTGVVDPVPL